VRVRLLLSIVGTSLLGLTLFAILDRAGVGGAGAISVLLILSLAAGLTLLLSQPFGVASDFAERLSRGGSPPRLPENAPGQTGDLYRALNRLAESHRSRVRQLGAEQAETEVLLSEMADGVLALDSNGSVVRANAELRAVVGSADPIEGRAMSSIFRNPDLVRFLAPAALPADGANGEFEVFGRNMLVTARPLPTDGIVAVFSDVTELRRLDAVRTEFVSNASHELKTPLTTIRGYAETLLDDGIPESDRQSFAARIVDHSERMAALVEDMLTLARLEEPDRWIERVPVRLSALAESISSDLALRAADAGIELVLECEPPELRALADPEGVRQVLENLIDNAIRHSSASQITVRASKADSNRVNLSIEDDGRGIPVAQLERIFERFYRIDPSRSRETGGTGLGLAIVRHWVESMGGDVRAESTLNEGTAFHVRLPAMES
jgi:two-component system phosphate regulon sensor histidine kinase PhoR